MSCSRPTQWYHSHTDPIWPDDTFYFRWISVAEKQGMSSGIIGTNLLRRIVSDTRGQVSHKIFIRSKWDRKNFQRSKLVLFYMHWWYRCNNLNNYLSNNTPCACSEILNKIPCWFSSLSLLSPSDGLWIVERKKNVKMIFHVHGFHYSICCLALYNYP